MFGGSFDPVHNEHIALCSMMLKKFNLDKVLVLPAFCSPFKAGTQSSDLHRLNMCRLAFEDVDIIQVGARNMQNFDLLKALGKIDKPVLDFIYALKTGALIEAAMMIGATPWCSWSILDRIRKAFPSSFIEAVPLTILL